MVSVDLVLNCQPRRAKLVLLQDSRAWAAAPKPDPDGTGSSVSTASLAFGLLLHVPLRNNLPIPPAPRDWRETLPTIHITGAKTVLLPQIDQ